MIIREITALANMDGFGLPSPISGVLFGGEDQAHKFIIRREDGTAFAGTVTAKFLRYADDVTVPLTGTIEDGKATVTLIENCYMRPGRFKLTVYVTQGESTTAVYCCMGTVDRTDGQRTIDPSGEINLDVTDLINRIDEAVDSIPPTWEELSGEVDELKSATDASNVMFSDGATILSDNLTDGTSTVSGVEYTMSGNTLQAEGEATANSLYVWAGATNAVPDFITAGGKYILSVDVTGTATGTYGALRIQIKTTDNTSLRSLYDINRSGTYIIEIPANVTALRIISIFYSGSVVDMNITAELSNAIDAIGLLSKIAANSGGIAALTAKLKNLAELSAADATTIPDNSDINSYLTPGTYKITNKTHANTMTNLPVKLPGKLIVMELSQANRVTQFFIPVSTANTFFMQNYDGTTWTGWESFSKSSVVNNFISAYNKRNNLKILHESGSYASGRATERISVYVPTTSGYIMYRLYHFVDNSIKCDVWQIYHAYHVDDNLENQTDLTITGEWECAIHLDGRSDFSGGSTHGDEVMSEYTLLIDGVPTTPSALTSLTDCGEIRMIRTSKMYDPSDDSRAIADHGVEYIFNKDALTINQSLKWLVAEELTNCFMAMFLPSKNQIDRAAINSDFEIITLASSTAESTTGVVKSGGTAITMWDTETGFSAEVSCPVYPTGLTGGDSMSITDNNGNNYNKVYFKVCGGGNSAVGDLWKSKTVYKLNMQ